jgi:hypothetical protein
VQAEAEAFAERISPEKEPKLTARAQFIGLF